MIKLLVSRARVLAPPSLLLTVSVLAVFAVKGDAQPGAAAQVLAPNVAEKIGVAQNAKSAAVKTKLPPSESARPLVNALTSRAVSTSLAKNNAPVAPQNAEAKMPASKNSSLPASAENAVFVKSAAATKGTNSSVKNAVKKNAIAKEPAAKNVVQQTKQKNAMVKNVASPQAAVQSAFPIAATGVATKNAAPKKAVATNTARLRPGATRVLAKSKVVAEAPKSVAFPNGARLVLRFDRAAPLIAISLLVRAGAADESAATAGWRRLLMEAMLRTSSAEGLDAKLRSGATAGFLSGTQIQTRADELGGRIGASVGDDAIEIWASGPSENAAQLTDLLLSVALRPRLDESDVATARDRLLLRGDDAQEDPSAVATTALRTQLYRDADGRAAAYALPLFGTETTLAALSREQLRDLHTRFFVPSRFVVAAAGDVDEAALESRFASLSGSAASAPNTAPFLAPLGRNEPPLVVRQVPSNQAWVFVSYRVAKAGDADLPALRVLAAALGEARGARLPNRLLGSANPSVLSPARRRTTAASASQVSVSFTPRRFGTEFIALAQTDAASVEGVKNAMLDEIRKLRDAPLSATEFSRARDFVLGSFATDRETLRERAYLAALSQSYASQNAASTRSVADLQWPARVAKVTRADVQRVARKYLTNYAVALLMPLE